MGCNVKIFNRWGEVVFETSDYNNDWGGTKNGEAYPMVFISIQLLVQISNTQDPLIY